MKVLRRVVASWSIFFGSGALLVAQMTSAPVLGARPVIPYPPIAKAAHVGGDVVVRFSIDSDGRTESVQTVSGPIMLRSSVEGAIQGWRFQTPLPVNAEQDFEATYRFRLTTGEEPAEDDLDAPPYVPCCGDMIVLSAGAVQVTGEVHSINGNQTIDVTPAAVVPIDRCPDEKRKSPPSRTEDGDFAEPRLFLCRR